MLTAPFVQNGAVNMMSKGEISYRGQGGTPFFPPNVRIPPPHGMNYFNCRSKSNLFQEFI